MKLHKLPSKTLDIVQHFIFLKQNNHLKKANNIFTHLTNQEKRQLFYLSQNVNDGIAVEIGSFVGASSCFIASGICTQSKLLCIDTWQNNAMSEGERETFVEFRRNTAAFKHKIHPVKGFSTEVVDDIKKISANIDFLFIDGDHSYKGCKSDWETYKPMLKKGSCVIFHDSGWAEGVIKVIEEDAKPQMVNIGTLPNMFWGYIK